MLKLLCVVLSGILKPTCKPTPAKDHIFSTAEKKQQTGNPVPNPEQPNPVQHPMEWTVSMVQSGQL